MSTPAKNICRAFFQFSLFYFALFPHALLQIKWVNDEHMILMVEMYPHWHGLLLRISSSAAFLKQRFSNFVFATAIVLLFLPTSVVCYGAFFKVPAWRHGGEVTPLDQSLGWSSTYCSARFSQPAGFRAELSWVERKSKCKMLAAELSCTGKICAVEMTQ